MGSFCHCTNNALNQFLIPTYVLGTKCLTCCIRYVRIKSTGNQDLIRFSPFLLFACAKMDLTHVIVFIYLLALYGYLIMYM